MVRKPAKRFFFEGGREHESSIHRGHCVVVAPHEVRKFRCTAEGDVTLVSLEPSVLQSMLTGSASNPFELLRRWNGDDPVLRELILKLQADVAAGCPGGPVLGESISTRLAEELLQRYSLNRSRLDQYTGGLSGAQLRRTLEYIDASLSSGLTGDGIAGIAGLSNYHFGKAFKQSTGMTLHSYVLARRMWRAQELLAKSDLPLAAVAQAAGFSSQSHFTTMFSTRTGFSPGSYRSMAKPSSVLVRGRRVDT
jgi:AraC family transcriptional regulator